MIHQRTMAGLAAARVQGRIGGRPGVMEADKLAATTARLARGESPTRIAKALGLSRATLYRHANVIPARGQSSMNRSQGTHPMTPSSDFRRDLYQKG